MELRESSVLLAGGIVHFLPGKSIPRRWRLQPGAICRGRIGVKQKAKRIRAQSREGTCHTAPEPTHNIFTQGGALHLAPAPAFHGEGAATPQTHNAKPRRLFYLVRREALNMP